MLFLRHQQFRLQIKIDAAIEHHVLVSDSRMKNSTSHSFGSSNQAMDQKNEAFSGAELEKNRRMARRRGIARYR